MYLLFFFFFLVQDAIEASKDKGTPKIAMEAMERSIKDDVFKAANARLTKEIALGVREAGATEFSPISYVDMSVYVVRDDMRSYSECFLVERRMQMGVLMYVVLVFMPPTSCVVVSRNLTSFSYVCSYLPVCCICRPLVLQFIWSVRKRARGIVFILSENCVFFLYWKQPILRIVMCTMTPR